MTTEEEGEKCVVRYGVDAMRLGRGGGGRGGKEVKKGVFDKVVFNFPHVGGRTKDVNRQVRYNQGMLVSQNEHAHYTVAIDSIDHLCIYGGRVWGGGNTLSTTSQID